MFDQISGGGYVAVVRRGSGRAQPLKKKNNEIYKISKKFFSNTEKESMEHYSVFTVKFILFMYSCVPKVSLAMGPSFNLLYLEINYLH